MSDHETPTDHRPDDNELTHTAALAENALRTAAESSEAQAAAAREAGDHATAGVHDIFAQAERTEAGKIGEEILGREVKRPQGPQA